MRREIFSDVVRPSVKLGTRAWYTLPLSIAAHVLIGIVVIFVPLMATDVLPKPATVLASFVTTPPPPVPPPPPAAAAPPRTDAPVPVNPNAAPLSAPDRIAPETPSSTPPDLGPGVEGGVPREFAAGTAPVMSAIPEPPPAPAPTQPVRVGSLIKRPTKIRDVRPIYPPIAQTARVTGRVMIEATIGADGRVTNARVIKSVPLLDQAALDAVRQWEFTPTRLNGVAIPIIMTVTIDFTLRQQ